MPPNQNNRHHAQVHQGEHGRHRQADRAAGPGGDRGQFVIGCSKASDLIGGADKGLNNRTPARFSRITAFT